MDEDKTEACDGCANPLAAVAGHGGRETLNAVDFLALSLDRE